MAFPRCTSVGELESWAAGIQVCPPSEDAGPPSCSNLSGNNPTMSFLSGGLVLFQVAQPFLAWVGLGEPFCPLLLSIFWEPLSSVLGVAGAVFVGLEEKPFSRLSPAAVAPLSGVGSFVLVTCGGDQQASCPSSRHDPPSLEPCVDCSLHPVLG